VWEDRVRVVDYDDSDGSVATIKAKIQIMTGMSGDQVAPILFGKQMQDL
jgi:ATP-dependent exoDNAse (exonuclease V) alpha subunit